MNGLEAEGLFLEALRNEGFGVESNIELDNTFKVDCVLLAPPGKIYFPSAVAIQFTTRRNDWDKRRQFVLHSSSVAPRRAFVEVVINGRSWFSPNITGPLLASMLALMYNQQAIPEIALVSISDNIFSITNLVAELQSHEERVEATTGERIHGKVAVWKRAERYGFIHTFSPNAENGQTGLVSYFFHESMIDDNVRQALMGFDGCVPYQQQVRVTFVNAGIPNGKNRPTADGVRLAG